MALAQLILTAGARVERLTLCEVCGLEKRPQPRGAELRPILGVGRVECLHEVRLLVRRCISRVMVCPFQSRHVENAQALHEWIYSRVEGAFFDLVVVGINIDTRVRVRSANAKDLASSHCIAGVAVPWVLRRVVDFEPAERGQGKDEDLVVRNSFRTQVTVYSGIQESELFVDSSQPLLEQRVLTFHRSRWLN